MTALHRFVSLRFGFGRVRRAAPRTALHLRRRSRLEPLEQRQMLSATVRTIDGSLNNLSHPDWGSAGTQLLRAAPAAYSDGVSAPAGTDRPSAREISNTIVAQSEDIVNDHNLSAMVYAWGQFIDHDIDLTSSATPYDPFPVQVPLGDAYFDPDSKGGITIGLNRSKYDPATGTDPANPRQQINDITAFIDGSMIYGSDAARAAALRTFEGGRLKTSDGAMLPYNILGLPNDNAVGAPADTLFLAGDVRANENIELTSLQTLFVREHNRLADKYAATHPKWSDEQIYQAARRMVVAELQAITYNEFLPSLLGPAAMTKYRGYNPSVNLQIANEFSTAGFRLGHSMLGDDIQFLDNQGEETHDEVELREAFFNPALVQETGIDSILKYLASDPAQQVDNHIVDDVRNFLFGAPGAGGFDLASLNIQRGRDHGLADYNATRVAYGLPAVTSFDQITGDVEVQGQLESMYGSVNNIDLWVGGLAEDHVRGGNLGPLFTRIVADQFQRLRDGDRYWYQRDLTKTELAAVTRTSLADVIRMNTTTTNLQDNVFIFRTVIVGRVQIDSNRDGRITLRDAGVPGVTVQLLDLDGNVVDSTVTGFGGFYAFEGVDLGTYQVRLSLPESMRQITREPRDVELTRGQIVVGGNFGIKLVPPSPGRSSPADVTDAAIVDIDEPDSSVLDAALGDSAAVL